MTPWDTDRHEALDDGEALDDAVAREAIREIVDDAVAAWDEARLFPWHPRDAEYAHGDGTEGAHGLYMGAAGVWWAIGALRRDGSERAPLRVVWERHDRAPDLGQVVPSWFLGRSGILAARLWSEPSAALRDALDAELAANQRNPTWEALWGSPGTMDGARLVASFDDDPRWVERFREGATFLLEVARPVADCWLWEQDLYGQKRFFVGAGHGTFGNLHPLLEGLRWLAPAQRERVLDLAEQAAVALAIRSDGLANWPSVVGSDKLLVQWCHGAPGVITSLRRFPVGRSPRVDALLEAGAELVWRAGPLRKGPGLCHGTAGNGVALLVMHARTGDPRWLQRARGFAAHALRQVRTERERVGRGRYSLWTGDLGVALFVEAVLRGDDGLPTLDWMA